MTKEVKYPETRGATYEEFIRKTHPYGKIGRFMSRANKPYKPGDGCSEKNFSSILNITLKT